MPVTLHHTDLIGKCILFTVFFKLQICSCVPGLLYVVIVFLCLCWEIPRQ